MQSWWPLSRHRVFHNLEFSSVPLQGLHSVEVQPSYPLQKKIKCFTHVLVRWIISLASGGPLQLSAILFKRPSNMSKTSTFKVLDSPFSRYMLIQALPAIEHYSIWKGQVVLVYWERTNVCIHTGNTTLRLSRPLGRCSITIGPWFIYH